MEPNFYENLIAPKDKEKLELIKKQSKLLDEPLDKLIFMREKRTEEHFVNKVVKNVKNITLDYISLRDINTRNFRSLLNYFNTSRNYTSRYIISTDNFNIPRRRRENDSGRPNSFLESID